jgi:hypothetical protein
MVASAHFLYLTSLVMDGTTGLEVAGLIRQTKGTDT